MFDTKNIIKKDETGFVNYNNPFKKILKISFVYEKEIKNRFDVLIDFVETASLIYLSELLKINPDAKVIVSSGHSIDRQKQSLKDTGSVAYIAKPYKLVDLSKIIRQVLDN
jgi:DNA-binding NtrC family response regulator